MRQNNNQNKDLQKIKTSWDHNLVKQLIKEATFNNEDIKKITINEHGILNRNIIKKKYGDLQEYSDIFGLPVWSLMTEEASQEVMPSVKDDLDKNIQPFRISDLEEILNYISVQTKGLTLSNNEKINITLILDTLKNILKRHEKRSETWQVLFSLNQDNLKRPNDYDWICNLLFTYNSEIIYRGTLRFYKKSLKDLLIKPPNIKESFKTSWFFIKKMIPTAKKPRLILSIVDDISSEIFSCNQPNISMNTENDEEMLFSWNSNFKTKVISLPDLTVNFRNRMRNLNSISKHTIFNMNEVFYGNEPEITRMFKENKRIKNQTMDRSSRISNTLDYLLINGYINDGDPILFKNGDDSTYNEVAEIIIAYKRTMLLWRGEIYFFTKLTHKLLNLETPPNYCAKYWYLPDCQYSLYELANFNKMVNKF